MKRLLLIAFSTLLLTAARAESPQVPEGQPADSVARVGDQTITYSQLNTQLNSSPVVGLSVPVLGSAERNTVMLTLLDKAISVNLLYLDATERGTGKTWRRSPTRFSVNSIVVNFWLARSRSPLRKWTPLFARTSPPIPK